MQVTMVHLDKRACRRLTCRAEPIPRWGAQKPGSQHGNGDSPATDAEGGWIRGEGGGVPAGARHRSCALASPVSTGHRVGWHHCLPRQRTCRA